MAKALAAIAPALPFDLMRIAIVCGSALALIAAGRALPLLS